MRSPTPLRLPGGSIRPIMLNETALMWKEEAMGPEHAPWHENEVNGAWLVFPAEHERGSDGGVQ